jgi:hypothetical protein
MTRADIWLSEAAPHDGELTRAASNRQKKLATELAKRRPVRGLVASWARLRFLKPLSQARTTLPVFGRLGRSRGRRWIERTVGESNVGRVRAVYGERFQPPVSSPPNRQQGQLSRAATSRSFLRRILACALALRALVHDALPGDGGGDVARPLALGAGSFREVVRLPPRAIHGGFSPLSR